MEVHNFRKLYKKGLYIGNKLLQKDNIEDNNIMVNPTQLIYNTKVGILVTF